MEMKTQYRPNYFWNSIFSILLVTLHVQLGLCRPTLENVHDRIVLQNASNSIQDALGHHDPQVMMPLRDLNIQDVTDIQEMREGSHPVRDYNASLFYSQKDLIDYLSTSPDDVIDDGDDVMTPLTDRNLVRKRRQPEGHRPHRRRRRKHHRLVLKARDGSGNHLPSGKDGFKDRHVIRSDSPGYVITSASEVKKDWCKTIPLRHRVSEAGCRSRVVQNNFCYGQCNSFFIPHTSRTDSKVAFQSCAVCKPVRKHLGNVTLNCPGQNPPKVIKTVLFVDECRCVSEVMK